MYVVRSTCMFKFMHVGMACQHENVLYWISVQSAWNRGAAEIDEIAKKIHCGDEWQYLADMLERSRICNKLRIQ
jgi:hypothetical protein